MRLAILKAGTALPKAREQDGDYDRMFIDLLAAPGRAFHVYDVEGGAFPDDLAAHDAYLVTGSKASVYDGDPWIRCLLDTTAEIYRRGLPLIGICFGHQVVAQALGGEAAKNPEGWEVGVRPLHLTAEGREMAAQLGLSDPLLVLQTHQDIVTRLPPKARHLAWGPRTPFEMFAIGDRVFAMQGHPEMHHHTVRELIQSRRLVIPPVRAEEGLASLDQPHYRKQFRAVIDLFLVRGSAARAAS